MAKKPLAALIIAKMKKGAPAEKEAPSSELEEEMPEDDYTEEGMVAAAEDVMSALKSGDSRAFADALKSFVEQC